MMHQEARGRKAIGGSHFLLLRTRVFAAVLVRAAEPLTFFEECMFRRWLRRWPFHSASQVRNIRQNLDMPPRQINLDALFPLFVPASFLATGLWPGPVERLRAPGIGLTWVVEQPGQTMRYVDRGIVAYWEQQEIDWRTRAVANVLCASKSPIWTHELRREGGELYAAFFMHDDGYGPSRLLLTAELQAAFPAGYHVGLPEMSCGLALSKDAGAAERQRVDQIVAGSFEKGTRPLVAGILDSSDLLPEPADPGYFSNSAS